MSGCKISFIPDPHTLTIAIPSHPLAFLRLTTTEVDLLISQLHELRAKMEPTFPHECPKGLAYKGTENPSLSAEPGEVEGTSLLHIRDPGFGWLHYLIPKDAAQGLGQARINHANTTCSSDRTALN